MSKPPASQTRVRTAARASVAMAVVLLMCGYIAAALLIVVPENPATLPLRSFRRVAAQVLGQDWRLFSPDLNSAEGETIVTVRFQDGSESPPFSLSSKFHDLSVRGVRRIVPSRLTRVLEGAEININNATLMSERVAAYRARAKRGDPVAKAMLEDPRFRAIEEAVEPDLKDAMARYRRVVTGLTRYVFPESEISAIRASLVTVVLTNHRRLSEFLHPDASSLLDDLEQDIAEDVSGGRATMVDTGWFRPNALGSRRPTDR